MKKYRIEKVKKDRHYNDYYCDKCGKLIGTENCDYDDGWEPVPDNDYNRFTGSIVLRGKGTDSYNNIKITLGDDSIRKYGRSVLPELCDACYEDYMNRLNNAIKNFNIELKEAGFFPEYKQKHLEEDGLL